MYLVKTKIGPSAAHGDGVFVDETILAGEVVWRFVAGHDCTLSKEEFAALGDDEKKALSHVAYLSRATERWVFPPEGDPARFTNHSDTPNLTVVVNSAVSPEPLFVARIAIPKGEELTVDYRTFDSSLVERKLGWQ